MKKYLQDRNEQLFNRLFESQNIKPNLGEVHVVTGEPAEEGPSLTDLENLLRGEVEAKIEQGASPDQMAKLVADLDAIIAYKLAGQGYASPLKELGIPEMTAWQHLEEDERESEEKGDGDKALLKRAAAQDVDAQKAMTDKLVPTLFSLLNRGEVQSWIKKIDTSEELTWFTGLFIDLVNDIAGTDLNDQEIDRSAFDLRKYLKQLRDDRKETEDSQTEAHAIATPNREDDN